MERIRIKISDYKPLVAYNNWEAICYGYGKHELSFRTTKTGTKILAYVLYPDGNIKKQELEVYERVRGYHDHGKPGTGRSNCLRFNEEVNGYKYVCTLDRTTELKFYIPEIQKYYKENNNGS